MIDLPLTTIIIGLFVIFLAGLTQGLAGFGFALVTVPIMIIFLSPKIVVPIVIILGTLITIVISFKARKWVDLKRFYPLTIAGIVGVPLGTYLLIILDVSVLKASIGSAIILLAVAFLGGFKKKIKNEKLALAPVGFISGLLQGSISISGPPVALFFTNQGVKKQIFRANLIGYLMVLYLATIPVFVLGGLITVAVVKYAILFLPAMIFGAITGIKLARRIEEKFFRNIALIIITILGLFSIASGLGIL